MLRYILVLLLTNSSYRSLGNPINPTAPVALANSLTTLANNCENTFLSSQIKANVLSCTMPHGEKQLQCLVFYDINKQLCAAVAADKIALPETDYMTKINEEQDVNSLCLIAKDWVFTNLTEFTRYKQAVDKVFKHPVTCGKICSGEDFMSYDSNYFCKYYKWGTEVMKQAITASTQNTASNVQIPQEQPDVNKDDSVLANSDLQDVQIKETSSTNTKISAPTSNAPVSELQAKVEVANPEPSSLAINQKSQSVAPETLSNVAAVPEVQNKVDTADGNVEDTGPMPENTLEEQPSKSTVNVAPKVETAQGSVTKAKLEETQNKPEGDVKIEENKELQQLNNELESKQPVLEPPKGKGQPNEIEDYPDSDEGKESLPDMQGDDSDDGTLGDPVPEELKPDNVDSIPSTLEKEKMPSMYTGAIQSSYPEEEDDHFFSFFLTAIVLVVLLYVLYHNKNKVGKVFFGLVLEGRQAGRRRNSRGHAYRRLDTLEQAMSASSTAPPSKIIY